MQALAARASMAGAFLAVAAGLLPAGAGEFGEPVPGGIAAKYPGDIGITNDPDVVFVEDFEEGSLAAVKARWESIKDSGVMSLSTNVPAAGTGNRSLLMTHVGGQGTGGHLYRRLLPGYDKLHCRFYVRFDPNCGPIHHFVHMGGYNPSTSWPQGGAGTRPAGDERLTTGIEPFGDTWRWDFYSYWMRMRACPTGDYWGNDFVKETEGINDTSPETRRGHRPGQTG